MSSAQLYLRRYRTFSFGAKTVHRERVFALMRINQSQPSALLLQGVVDTGAPVTVFPQLVWQKFAGEISWLSALNDPGVPSWCKEFGGVAGGVIPCRVGTVGIEFYDHVGGRLGPTEIVAMFAYDYGQMTEVLVGLSGGPFTKRRLEMTYDTPAITLTDV